MSVPEASVVVVIQSFEIFIQNYEYIVDQYVVLEKISILN